VDVVFNGHVHNYQRSVPLKFDIAETEKPGKIAWKDLAGKEVAGKFSLDTNFDGITRTRPKGIIYIVSGAGYSRFTTPNNKPNRRPGRSSQ
jgi:acid phosphatase type 7